MQYIRQRAAVNAPIIEHIRNNTSPAAFRLYNPRRALFPPDCPLATDDRRLSCPGSPCVIRELNFNTLFNLSYSSNRTGMVFCARYHWIPSVHGGVVSEPW